MTHDNEHMISAGEVECKNLGPINDPSATAKGAIGPGIWTLASRSNLPFVKIAYAGHAKTISWGETIEIPQGNAGGKIINASYHRGDCVLQAVGSGRGYASYRPGAITVPAIIQPIGNPITHYRTSLVDTRLARRAYLWMELLIGPPNTLGTTIVLIANRGFSAGPLTTAATTKNGNPSFFRTLTGYVNNIPLGYASGENNEPLPASNSIPELRAMALLDAVYCEWTLGDATGAGINQTTDAYFVVEY